MSQAISKYPGTVPRAHFLNHDHQPDVNGLMNYVVSGENFDDLIEVFFYDFVTNQLIADGAKANPELTATVPVVTSKIGGALALDPGMYQLVLRNPGGTLRPQAAWISVEDPVTLLYPTNQEVAAKRKRAKKNERDEDKE